MNNSLKDKLCEAKYPDIKDPSLSLLSFFAILGLLACAIATEVVTFQHFSNSTSTSSTPKPEEPSSTAIPPTTPTDPDDANPEPNSTTETSDPAPPPSQTTDSKPNTAHTQPSVPTPYTRATRFAAATLLLIPITLLFTYRVLTAFPHYGPICATYPDSKIARTSVPLFILLNITPLIVACCAWLRSLVDCVLVRWGKTLSYSQWPVLLPLFGVVILPAGLVVAIMYAVRDGCLRVMGVENGEGKEKAKERALEDGAEEYEVQALVGGEGDRDAVEDDDEETVYGRGSDEERRGKEEV